MRARDGSPSALRAGDPVGDRLHPRLHGVHGEHPQRPEQRGELGDDRHRVDDRRAGRAGRRGVDAQQGQPDVAALAAAQDAVLAQDVAAEVVPQPAVGEEEAPDRGAGTSMSSPAALVAARRAAAAGRAERRVGAQPQRRDARERRGRPHDLGQRQPGGLVADARQRGQRPVRRRRSSATPCRRPTSRSGRVGRARGRSSRRRARRRGRRGRRAGPDRRPGEKYRRLSRRCTIKPELSRTPDTMNSPTSKASTDGRPSSHEPTPAATPTTTDPPVITAIHALDSTPRADDRADQLGGDRVELARTELDRSGSAGPRRRWRSTRRTPS